MSEPRESPFAQEQAENISQPAENGQGMSLVDLMEVHGEVGQHAWPLDPRLPLPEGVPAPAPAPWAWFWGVAKLCLVLAVAASLSFNYSEVRGASMMPGIHDRDRILVDHVSLAFTEIEHGDVVVLRYPLDPRMDYIKRVVGLPGDEIVVQFGGVWVNGKPVEEPYVSVSALDPYTSVHTVVKPGHYFVLGDNRIRSSDSREFGQVPQELIRGLVRLRVWPLDRIGWIH